MPRETVFSCDRPYTDESAAQSVVGVNWGGEMDGYVQVSTALFNDDGKYVGIDVETGEMVVRQATGDEALRRELWSQGFYVNLDRAGINKLIRHLRTARDKAFGRDE